jgi:hypothetical protein
MTSCDGSWWSWDPSHRPLCSPASGVPAHYATCPTTIHGMQQVAGAAEVVPANVVQLAPVVASGRVDAIQVGDATNVEPHPGEREKSDALGR